MARIIVRVQIILPLLRRVLAVEMLVLQLAGHRAGFAPAQVLFRGQNGVVRRIAFGRGCHQHARFRQAQLQGAVHAGLHDGNGLRVRKAHVLRRDDQQPPAGRQQIPGFQNARQIMHGGVRVRASNAFLQRRDAVVVHIVAFVVALAGALRHLAHGLCCQPPSVPAAPATANSRLPSALRMSPP